MLHKPFYRDNHDQRKQMGEVIYLLMMEESTGQICQDHGRCLPPERVVTPLRADVVGERCPFCEFATRRTTEKKKR